MNNLNELNDLNKEEFINLELDISNCPVISQVNTNKIFNEFDTLVNDFNNKLVVCLDNKLKDKKLELKQSLGNMDNEFENKNKYLIDQNQNLENNLDIIIKKKNRINILSIKFLVHQKEKTIKYRVFTNLLTWAKYKKNRKRRMNLAFKSYENNILRQLFRFWKNYNSEKTVIKKINKTYADKLKENKSWFLKKIQEYKKVIVQIDEKINLVKSTRTEFSYSFSQNLLKKISTLNNELGNINKDDLSALNKQKKPTNQVLEEIARNINNSYNNI